MILQVTGSSFTALLENSAKLFLALNTDPSTVGETLREKLVVEDPTSEGLLTAWANSLFQLAQHQHLLIRRVKILAVTGDTIRADVFGEFFDPHRHPLKENAFRLECLSATAEPSSEPVSVDFLFNVE